MDSCLDPYEQQLLQVFESYDFHQTGTLDHEGLSQLCASLQLEEQGACLIRCLLSNTSKTAVTFYEFKDALLALLRETQNLDESKETTPSDDESPDREVSPKYIYGAKKYGRRSRPRADNYSPNTDNDIILDNKADVKLNKIQRSSSQNDVHPSKKRKSNTKLKRCTSFPDAGNGSPVCWSHADDSIFSPITASPVDHREMETAVLTLELWNCAGVGKNGTLTHDELTILCKYVGENKLSGNVVKQLFTKLNSNESKVITLHEFEKLYKPNDTTTHRSNIASDRMVTDTETFQKSNLTQLISLGPDGSGVINVDIIVEMWENAGVTSAYNFLCDLGFTQNQVNVVKLAEVLEEELRTYDARGGLSQPIPFSTNPQMALLQASLALYQAEVRCLRSTIEHMNAERDKLKSDIADANERANLLALEVDDNHAKMEKATREQVRHLEQRHAEILRDFSAQLTTDREQASLLSQKLEQRCAALQAEEIKLKMQLSTLSNENASLERENHHLSEQVSELESNNTELTLHVNTLEGEKQKICDMEGNREREQMMSYLEKISVLQFENTALKDKNDELCIELESISAQLSAIRIKKSSTPVQNASQVTNDSVEENVSSIGSTSGYAVKRRGDASNKSFECSLEEESPRIGKLRKYHSKTTLRELPDGLKIMPFNTSESGLDVDFDYGDSSISITSSDGGSEEESPMSLRARITYLEQLLRQYGHDLSSDHTQTKNLVADADETDLRERCQRLELLVREIKMGLHAKVNDESCSTTCSFKNVINDLQVRLEDHEVYKSVSQEDNTLVNKMTDEEKRTYEDLLRSNKELEQQCAELLSSLDLLRTEYERCEDYWANKLDEERQLFDQEQKQNNANFQELLNKMSELEEQYNTQDNKLPVIEENTLERQFTDLEDDYAAYKEQAENDLQIQAHENEKLKAILDQMEQAKQNTVDVATQIVTLVEDKCMLTDPEDLEEKSQTTQLSPNSFPWNVAGKLPNSPPNSLDSLLSCDNPFSTVCQTQFQRSSPNTTDVNTPVQHQQETVDNSSRKHSVHRNRKHSGSSAELVYRKDEIKRLRNIKSILDEECQTLHKQKEDLIKEVFDLQNKAKEIEEPFISFKWKGLRVCSGVGNKQTCRVSFGTLQELNGRLQQLDQRCRHLQQVLRKQQQQAESMLHQCWLQHKGEVTDLQYMLKSTQDNLEQQTLMCNDQLERLARTDLLVKDLYIENSYLLATVQRLEHHCHMLTQCNINGSSV